MPKQSAILEVGAVSSPGTIQAFRTVAQGLRELAKGFREDAKALADFGNKAKEDFLSSATQKINKFADSLDKEIESMKKAAETASQQTHSLRSAAESQEKLAKSAADTAKLEKEMADAMAQIVAESEDLSKAELRELNRLEEMKIRWWKLLTAHDRYGESARNVLSEIQQESHAATRLSTNLGILAQEQRKAASEATKLAAAQKKLQKVDPAGAGKYLEQLRKTSLTMSEQINVLDKLTAKRKAAVQAQRAEERETARAAASLKNFVTAQSALLTSHDRFGASARKAVAALSGEESAVIKLRSAFQKLKKEQASVISMEAKLAGAQRRLQQVDPAGAGKFIAGLRRSNLTMEEQLNVITKLIAKRRAALQAASEETKAEERHARAVEKLTNRYRALAKEQSAYGRGAANILRNLQTGLITNTDKARIALSNLSKSQEAHIRSTETLGQAMANLGSKFRGYVVYTASAMAVTTGILGSFRALTGGMIDYDQALKDIQAITSATDAEMKQYGETLKSVAAETKFSIGELAEGAKTLGQAGFSAAESMDIIRDAANLATGTLSDMPKVVDLMSTALRVFKLEAKDSAMVSDVFANAVNKSKLSIDKIRVAMNYMGPIAGAAGIKINELMSAMGAMANQGLRASTIGTGFKQALAAMLSPSEKLRTRLKEVGLSVDDLNVKLQRAAHGDQAFMVVLENLRKVLADTETGAIDLSLAFQLFNKRGGPAAVALVSDLENGYKRLKASIDESGTATDMANKQLEGLGARFKQLKDRVGVLAATLSEGGLGKALGALIDTARGLMTVLTALAGSPLAGFVAQLGVAVTAVWALSKALTFLKGMSIAKALMSWVAGLTETAKVFGVAATAAREFEIGLVALKGALASFLPAAIIMGVLALINHFSTLDEKITANIAKMGSLRKQYADTVSSLSDYLKKLEDVNTKESERQNILDTIISKYPDLAVSILEAGDNTDKLTESIREYIKESKKMEEVAAKNEVAAMFDKLERAQEKADKALRRMKLPFTDKEKWAQAANEADREVRKITLQIAKRLEELKKSGIQLEADDFVSLSVDDGENIMDDLAAGVDRAMELLEKHVEKRAQAISAKMKLVRFDYSGAQDNLKKTLYNIELEEAKGVTSHQEAEQRKVEATVQAYEKMLAEAKKYASMQSFQGAGAEEAAQAVEQVNEIQNKLDQARLERLKLYNSRRIEAEKKVVSAVKSQEQELAKYEEKLDSIKESRKTKLSHLRTQAAEKIKNIEKKLRDELKDIWEKYYDKLKDLEEKRVELHQKTRDKIANIDLSLEDKIAKIRQRGMTDAQKEADNYRLANERLRKGQELLAKAVKENDEGMLKRAASLIQKSEEYYTSLSDNGRAISGLRKTSEAMKEVAKAEEELGNKKIDAAEAKLAAARDRDLQKARENNAEELKDFQDKLKIKLKEIEDTYQKALKKEENRHQKEMSNLDAEIAKWREKARIASENQRLAAEKPVAEYLGTGARTESVDIPQVQEEIRQAVSQATQEGIRDGVQTPVDMSQTQAQVRQAVSQGSKAGWEEGVLVNGIPLEEWRKQAAEGGKAAKKEVEKELKNVELTVDEKAIMDSIKKLDADFDDALSEISVDVKADPGSVEGVKQDLETGLTDITAQVDGELDPASVESMRSEASRALDGTKAELGVEADTKKAEAQIKSMVRNMSHQKVIIDVVTRKRRAAGGPVHMASGGRLPGLDSLKDKIPVLARPGEWFVRNEAAKFWNQRLGKSFMEAVAFPMSKAGMDFQKFLAGKSQGVDMKQLGAMMKESAGKLKNFGEITLNLPVDGGPIPILATPQSADELVRQLSELDKLSSGI